MNSENKPTTSTLKHPLPLAEAQSRAVRYSNWGDIQSALEVLEPLRAEWDKESPWLFSGVAYLAGLTAGIRQERARRRGPAQ